MRKIKRHQIAELSNWYNKIGLKSGITITKRKLESEGFTNIRVTRKKNGAKFFGNQKRKK